MQMTELPQKEKATLQERRRAQRSEKPAASSKAYVLTSTLPAEYRTPLILPPAKIPTASEESTYMALTTFIVTLIFLSGGSMPDEKLMRQLRRMDIEMNNPLGSTDKLLKRMEKDGYLQKAKDTQQGDEQIDWLVGPRGRVEIGEQGASNMVKTVYGPAAADEELEKRLERSLGLNQRLVNNNATQAETQTQTQQQQQQPTQGRKRARPRRQREEDEDEESDEE